MQTYQQIPDSVTGYELNPEADLFAVILPKATINLVSNPSLETDAAGYAVVNTSAIARTTDQQRRGLYALQVTPSSNTASGVSYTAIALTAGFPYAASVDFLGLKPGIEYQIAIVSGSTIVARKVFTSSGRWQRPAVVYYPTSSASYSIQVLKYNSADTGIFYIDGLQLEQVEYPTTYCDGDQRGLLVNQEPAPYQWSGTPHASTSTRSANTRAGGRVVELRRLGFRVHAYAGLGKAPVTNIAQPFALIDGEQYQRQSVARRTLGLAGVVASGNWQQVIRSRAEIESALDRDAVTPEQPLIIRAQLKDGTQEIGEPVDLQCVYAGGLEESADNRHMQRLQITLELFQPYLQMDGERGAPLSYSATLGVGQHYILRQSAGGAWSNVGSADAQIRRMLLARSGRLYAAGGFSTIGGVSVVKIAQWNGLNWSAMGTGAVGAIAIVEALAEGADGSLYAGGSNITSFGGVASTANLGRWTGSAWASIGSANNTVQALTVGPDGTLYAGGSFTTIGGVTVSKVARWDGTTWTAMGSWTGSVMALAMGPDGRLYAASSLTAEGVKYWDGSSWVQIASGVSGGKLAFKGNVYPLYYVGSFTTIGGATAAGVAQWTGTAWQPLGAGLQGATSPALGIFDIQTLSNGSTLFGGQGLIAADNIPTPASYATWTGSAWQSATIAIPVLEGSINAIEADSANNLYFAVGSSLGSNTLYTATTNTIANPGTAPAAPRLVIRGPSTGSARLSHIINRTTGAGLYFNLVVVAGEEVTIELGPKIRAYSTLKGDILNTIAPGSAFSQFVLMPGANVISVLYGDTFGTGAILLTWRPQYATLNGTLYT